MKEKEEEKEEEEEKGRGRERERERRRRCVALPPRTIGTLLSNSPVACNPQRR